MTEKKKQATVGELIEKLKKYDPHRLVSLEGCDCWGDACDVVVVEGILCITRTDGCDYTVES